MGRTRFIEGDPPVKGHEGKGRAGPGHAFWLVLKSRYKAKGDRDFLVRDLEQPAI